MRSRLLPISVAILTTALTLAACGQGSPATSSGASAAGSGSSGAPIDIGAILPLTGDGAAFGPGMAAAAQIAVDEVNAAEGPLGRKLTLHIEDDATNPDQGVRAAHKLIDVNHVSAIVGTWSTTVTMAVFPLTVDARILHMNVSGSPEVSKLQPPGEHTIITVNATDTDLSKIVATALLQQGAKTATVMNNNDGATHTFTQLFGDAYEAGGGTILKSIEYAANQSDYTSEVADALTTKPDVFVVPCYTPDGALILKEAFQEGSNGNWVLPAWCLNDQLVELTGPEVVEGDQAFDLIPVKDSAAYKRLEGAYKEKTGTDLFSNVYAAHVYDSIHLLALAIQQTGSLDALELGQAIIAISNSPGTKITSFAEGKDALGGGGDLDYDGASGPIDLNQTGDMSPYVGLFAMENGKPVLKLAVGQKS